MRRSRVKRTGRRSNSFSRRIGGLSLSLLFPTIMNERRWTYMALMSALMLAIYVSTGNRGSERPSKQISPHLQQQIKDQIGPGSSSLAAGGARAPTGDKPASNTPDSSNAYTAIKPPEIKPQPPVQVQQPITYNNVPGPDNAKIFDPEFKTANLLTPGSDAQMAYNSALPPSQGFILPMLYFDMGPNNLFRLLRQGAVTAYRMSRTVVVPVFHRHPRMGDNAKNPFILPIFDTNYTVDLVWPADDTIDTQLLNQKVHTIDMRGFQQQCNSKLDAIIRCGDVDAKREDGLKHFARAASTPAAEEVRILNMNEIINPDNTPGHVDVSMYRCLGIIYGKKCLPDQQAWLSTYREIAPFYLRPRTMRYIADKFIERVLHNQPYLAVHWRYESDWLDMCRDGRPLGAIKRNRAICDLVTGLSKDQNIRTVFINNIKSKMTAYGLQSVYLASPPNNIDLIRLLNGAFPGNFYYQDDIFRFANETLFPGYLSNNYVSSFVEQEVCFKSKFYMGAPLSSWTQSVLVDRLVRDNENHESALDVVTAGSPPPQSPGFPPLVFQFPEGDFNFGKLNKF